jgi:hypothetical protein
LGSEIALLGADFQRAVQQGNVMRAEAAAPQLGQLPVESALRLLFLYAEKEPALLKAQLAATALSELRAGEREAAAKLLQGLVQRQ